MTTDHPTATAALVSALAELAVAGVTGHVSQALALLPGWAGGILGGLVVLVVGRLFGPTLDVHGHRLKARLTGKHRALPAPPETDAPDDPDPTG